jgi:hypothetical protein
VQSDVVLVLLFHSGYFLPKPPYWYSSGFWGMTDNRASPEQGGSNVGFLKMISMAASGPECVKTILRAEFGCRQRQKEPLSLMKAN